MLAQPVRHRAARNFEEVVRAYLCKAIARHWELFRHVVFNVLQFNLIISALISMHRRILEHSYSSAKRNAHNHIFHVHQIGNRFGLQSIDTHLFKAGKEHPALHCNHAVEARAFYHFVTMLDKHRKQIVLAVGVIFLYIVGQPRVHATAAHIRRVRHDHIVFLHQHPGLLNQRIQHIYNLPGHKLVCQTAHVGCTVYFPQLLLQGVQLCQRNFRLQNAAVLFRVLKLIQQGAGGGFLFTKATQCVSGQFSALLYRINVRVQVAAQKAAVVVAALHHHDKIRHLRGAVINVQTVEVMLHNAGGGVTVSIARAAVNLHQHIKQICQNMPAAHAGVDALYILRRQGGVALAQLGQLLRYLRLLRGFVQIILPLGFVKIRVSLAPQTAKAVFDHVPHDPVRRKQLRGGGDVLGANLDVLFQVGEHLLFRLGVVILVQPAHDLHSPAFIIFFEPVGFRDVVYQMADHAVLIREGQRQQQRHIVVHLLKQAGQAVAQRGALL